MPIKYPLVHEFVIVIADLYLPEECSTDAPALPGLERVARFGRRTHLADGWRPWLARRVGSADLAAEPAACVAARCANRELAGTAWLATPVHWVAGLTTLHLDNRGLLKLPMATLRALAADFHEVFAGSGFTLEALASGGFLIVGPSTAAAGSIEPARCVGASIAAALPSEPALRRLGSELEIWLHEHPVNRARSARGELPVTSLWMWGGGRLPPRAATLAASPSIATQRAYGRDPYLDGLWSARGASVAALPASLEDLLESPARRVVIVVELAELLEAEPMTGVATALAALDARWIKPATRLLMHGAARSLVVVANDRCLLLTRHDSLKCWRRASHGLTGLE